MDPVAAGVFTMSVCACIRPTLPSRVPAVQSVSQSVLTTHMHAELDTMSRKKKKMERKKEIILLNFLQCKDLFVCACPGKIFAPFWRRVPLQYIYKWLITQAMAIDSPPI